MDAGYRGKDPMSERRLTLRGFMFGRATRLLSRKRCFGSAGASRRRKSAPPGRGETRSCAEGKVSRLMFLGLLLSAPQFAFCQEKLDLHLHFEKDETHITTVTLDQTIDQSVEGKPQRLTQKLTTSYTIKVEDVDANGAATLSLHIDSQAYHAVSGSTTIDFDSAQPASIPPPAATALSALIGQGYFFTVSAESQV